MADETLRIGLIGAGKNTRERHIPGFQKVPNLEIVAVANRSRESGRQVADQFNIPQVYDSWEELLMDESIDAVCIGTWPNMHRTLTIAALEEGKHVLCEARMATDAAAAGDMLEASRQRAGLVAQLVPAPFTFKVDSLLTDMVSEGYLGDLLSVDIRVLGANFADFGGAMHWRFDRDISGYNTLNMGIWYESMIRWVGRATSVTAMTKVNVPYRRNEQGDMVSVSIPDHVDVLCRLANGAQAHLQFSAAAGLSGDNEVWLYGSEGTIKVDQNFNVFGGRRGENQLSEIPNPEEKQGHWRVEEEFANAIRGQEQITRTPFNVGVHYMEWTEAVARSAQTGQSVALPL